MDGSARKRQRTVARKAARQRERDLRAAQVRLQNLKARRQNVADMVDAMRAEGVSRYPGLPIAGAVVADYDRRIEITKGIFIDANVPAQVIVSRDLAVETLVRQGADQKMAEEYIDGLPVDDNELAA